MATVPGVMVDVGANVARMQQDMRKIQSSMEGGFAKILSSAKVFGGAFAGYLSMQGLTTMAEKAISAYEVSAGAWAQYSAD